MVLCLYLRDTKPIHMKKALFSFSVCLFSALLSAQAPSQNPCLSTKMMEANFQKHPELRQQYKICQTQLNPAQNAMVNTPQRTAVANYTIPVVFHILHQNGVENISDAQIMDAMAILNRDYNLQNTDTSDVIAAFKNIIGNAHITFELAKIDPNGHCTSGIDRFYDPKTANWQENPSDYIYTWDPQMYLNIYVVKGIGMPHIGTTRTSCTNGFTYLAGTLPTSDRMDAVVIVHGCIGSIGTSIPLTSRALTHEIGHYLK